MAKKDYNKSAQLALKLIDKFGSLGQLNKNVGDPIDVNQPWLGFEVEAGNYDANGALISITDRDYKQYPELTTVKAEKQILADAVVLTVKPKVGDNYTHEGDKWKIDAIGEIKPASVVVVWKLFVSR